MNIQFCKITITIEKQSPEQQRVSIETQKWRVQENQAYKRGERRNINPWFYRKYGVCKFKPLD